MKHIVLTLIGWPAGIILGNLLASAIWAAPAILHLDRLARRHHAEHMLLLHGPRWREKLTAAGEPAAP